MKLTDTKFIIGDRVKPATPEMVAELFANMDSTEQASFFNYVSVVASKWGGSFEFQLQAITDEDRLTLGGRRVMQGIGEYSHWGMVPRIKTLEEDNEN